MSTTPLHELRSQFSLIETHIMTQREMGSNPTEDPALIARMNELFAACPELGEIAHGSFVFGMNYRGAKVDKQLAEMEQRMNTLGDVYPL